jgi:hypothetical protein
MRYLLTLAAMAALPIVTTAQITFGAHGGINYSILSLKKGPATTTYTDSDEQDRELAYGNPFYRSKDEPKVRAAGIGIMIGGYADIPFNERFSFTPALNFSIRKVKQEVEYRQVYSFGFQQDVEETNRTNFTYLELPLQLTVKVTETIRFQMGPQVAYLLNGRVIEDWKAEYTDYAGNQVQDSEYYEVSGQRLMKNLRRFETGLIAGARYELPNGISVNLHYLRSLQRLEGEKYSKFNSTFYNVIRVSFGYTFQNT